MSEFLAELVALGAELVDDKGADWLDKAEATAREELPALARDVTDRLERRGVAFPDGVGVSEAEAGEVLDALAKAKTPLLRLGAAGFAWLVAELDDGDDAAARLRYLETDATFEERRAAIQAAGDAVFDDAKERNDAWDAIAETVAAIGQVGLQVLVAVARKAIGI